MENEKRERSHIKIVVIVFFVALFCAIGTALALNWNNWFGGSGKPQMSLSDVASGTYIVNINEESHTYNAKYIIDGVEVKVPAGEYASDQKDEVVFLVVNGGSLVIDGANIKKTSDNFYAEVAKYSIYGINSAIVVAGEGSKAMIANANFDIASSGANAVVALDGASANVKGSKTNVGKSYSAGFVAAHGGEIAINGGDTIVGNISEETVSTAGAKAFVATNAGKITVDGGTVDSNAYYVSPAVYSDGEVTINNATITTAGSPIAMISGDGKLVLNGGDYTAGYPFDYGIGLNAKYPYDYTSKSDQMFSSSVIFVNGAPTFVANNASLAQSSYVIPSANDDTSKYFVTFFAANNAKPTIELNNTTLMLGGEEIKMVGAANNSVVTFNNSNLKINREKNFQVDATSSVTGL